MFGYDQWPKLVTDYHRARRRSRETTWTLYCRPLLGPWAQRPYGHDRYPLAIGPKANCAVSFACFLISLPLSLRRDSSPYIGRNSIPLDTLQHINLTLGLNVSMFCYKIE